MIRGMSWTRLTTRIVLAGMSAIACGTVPPLAPKPTIASIVQRFDANTLMLRLDVPPEYLMWLNDVEKCSGLTGHLDDTFWVLPRHWIFDDGKWHRMAEHISSTHQIIFGMGYEMEANVVRHELLHHLLGVPKDSTEPSIHPPEYFVTRCGDLVK